MEKKQSSEKKAKLHPRNKHRGRYDFELLTKANPQLLSHVLTNKYGDTSINFFNNKAVLALNKALLKQYYHIEYWEIPNNYLCPPISGRADYIHYIADLINSGKKETGKNTRCLDIGVGANCIYPIIGVQEYDWAFVGSDIDTSALTSAHKIVLSNSSLAKKVELRHQSNTDHILKGIIKPNDNFDITICNPPFHASAQDAKRGTLRKLSNLKGKKISKAQLNFGGKNNELWCEGGEKAFVCRLITESKSFANSCKWFSSLVSKESNLPAIYRTLKRVEAKQVKTIQMGQGNKISRIVAWRFQ